MSSLYTLRHYTNYWNKVQLCYYVHNSVLVMVAFNKSSIFCIFYVIFSAVKKIVDEK